MDAETIQQNDSNMNGLILREGLASGVNTQVWLPWENSECGMRRGKTKSGQGGAGTDLPLLGPVLLSVTFPQVLFCCH